MRFSNQVPTWVWELVVVSIPLGATAILTNSPVGWLSFLAVLITFCHVQVSSRLAEHQAALPVQPVHCSRLANRYLVAKETLWIVVFFITGAWPAITGSLLLLLYPFWRKLYRDT